MSDKEFYFCLSEVENYSDIDAYVSDLALSSIWSEDVTLDELVPKLQAIYRFYNMPFRDMVYAAGYNQNTFAQRFCVPLRTVQHWCNGDRECPLYFRLAAAELLHVVVR